jgi:hypothetical protein
MLRLHRPAGCSCQAREHGLLTGIVPSHHTTKACVALDRLPRCLGVYVQVLCGPDLSWRTLPLLGGSILCQSHHDPYSCPSRNRAASSGGDRTDSISRALVARSTWEPVATSCLVWHLMTTLSQDADSKGFQGLECVLSRDTTMS